MTQKYPGTTPATQFQVGPGATVPTLTRWMQVCILYRRCRGIAGLFISVVLTNFAIWVSSWPNHRGDTWDGVLMFNALVILCVMCGPVVWKQAFDY